MPRLPADIHISLKRRGGPTHRIELVRQGHSKRKERESNRAPCEAWSAGLKVRYAASYTTTLCLVGSMRFERVNIAPLLFLPPCQVVAPRIELSATCSSDRFGQPALGYHALESGWQDSKGAFACSHDHRFAAVPGGSAATLHPVSSSPSPLLLVSPPPNSRP